MEEIIWKSMFFNLINYINFLNFLEGHSYQYHLYYLEWSLSFNSVLPAF